MYRYDVNAPLGPDSNKPTVRRRFWDKRENLNFDYKSANKLIPRNYW